ncbi:SusC/RagA family TonB-linked outer membrane protein [Flavobacterium quisquiliarum]|uniref:SusC/RagA family TonB-linked outer membrane protein n=1 Tax=Flavobacterium quisquiliarum TaxID=1834436 RepID=A0ABV8WEF1_9FLAO|nr:SusC/RagA family TonB-linked outer membrane protein [Flavobacterium quisquiliarum]MBW1657780.1 SusC/RagA family TonB-linked outer membrane protein [Flavobacterium quisquiliarum]NWL04119.1 SusC/RagA family TonB-linked outer membrane protein [Flavobacterium collinsii]
MKQNLKRLIVLFFVLGMQLSFAQVKKIVGTVSGTTGPIPGVNVIVKGTANGVQTDFDGKYSINAKEGDVLVFSFVGMENSVVKIGNSNTINVSMQDGVNLNEVVVVGYGTTTNKSFTGTFKQIKADVLERKNVTNVSQALAGEIAGVRVINTSGQPGKDATIRIRGIGTVNASADPLYVVDGVPFSGNISSINFSDIESTTVLKDASATAIYGSRGANGVIIINTKSGKSSKSYIQVETKIGNNISLIPRYSVIKSADEYIALGWEGLYNQGVITKKADPVAYANQNLFNATVGVNPAYNSWNVANGGELIDPVTRTVRSGVTKKYTPENWEDYAFQASLRSETNLTMGGGEGKTNYYSSFGYLEDKGYSINSDFKRLSTRLNVNHQIRTWLKGSVNMGYTYSKSNNNGQTSDSNSVFWFVDNMAPIYPLFQRDSKGNILQDPIYGGGLYDYGQNRRFGSLTNAISDAYKTVDRTGRHELNLNVSFDLQFTKGLNLETRVGSQYFNSSRDLKGDSFYGSSAQQNGSLDKTKNERLSYNILNLLRFKKDIGSHSIEALVAHESNKFSQAYMYASGHNLFDPNGLELNNAVVSSPSSSYTYGFSLESYFSQLNYNYKDTYFLSGTVRRDGSSKFINNKWGTFGSVGASWVISNESFMQNQKIFSSLKLKTSYGVTGEQGVTDSNGNLDYYPGVDKYSINNLNDDVSLAFLTKGNPDLTWEKSKQFQVGVEFSLGSYIDATIDYYSKNTSNLLFDRRVGPSLGYAIMKVNDGQLLNSGLEFDVTAHLLKGKNYFVDFNVNGELPKNEMLKMPIDPATGQEKIIDIATIYGRADGHSLYDFYVPEYVGVDSQTGVAQWKAYYYDANGNGQLDGTETYIKSLYEWQKQNPDKVGNVVETITTTYANAANKFIGKSSIPKVRGAFTLSTKYKAFSLSTQFLYSLGGYAYDSAYQSLMHNGYIGSNNWSTDIKNRWQNPGDITDVPRLSNTSDISANGTSSRFVTKANYLSLNNIRLGYSLPKEFLHTISMNSLDIYASGDNLMLFSARKGFNPAGALSGQSSTYTYAPMSTISLGVKANF